MWPNARISVMGGDQAADVLATVHRKNQPGQVSHRTALGMTAVGMASSGVGAAREGAFQAGDPRSLRPRRLRLLLDGASVGRRYHRAEGYALGAGTGPWRRDARRGRSSQYLRRVPHVSGQRRPSVTSSCNHRSDALVREQLHQKRMRLAPVDDMRGTDALRQATDTALDFGNHSAGNDPVMNLRTRLLDVEDPNQRIGVVAIAQHPRDVRHQHELLRLQRRRDLPTGHTPGWSRIRDRRFRTSPAAVSALTFSASPVLLVAMVATTGM